ncbi:MAG TPA: 4Fe-4S dicluster domain-containing protein [Syntrophales bacterium]|nr:4Fe-4S dicluster domain-containing protein [Syntrophales bacterium]
MKTVDEKTVTMNRRKFLEITGVSTIVGLLGGWGLVELFAPGELDASYLPKKEALVAQRWAMLIDMKKFTDQSAEQCIRTCHRIHNVPDISNPKREIKWIWLEHFANAFPGEEHEHMPESIEEERFFVMCNHCDNPPCVRVCPTKATWQRKDGIIMMDQHRCIGCRYCMAACPFGARSFNWGDYRSSIKNRNPEYPTREKGVVEKCNFCAERLAKGLIPACVEESKGAMIFGDLMDEQSELRKSMREHYTIRRKPYLGTNPQVYYVI